jgi:hypothetical protein
MMEFEPELIPDLWKEGKEELKSKITFTAKCDG